MLRVVLLWLRFGMAESCKISNEMLTEEGNRTGLPFLDYCSITDWE